MKTHTNQLMLPEKRLTLNLFLWPNLPIHNQDRPHRAHMEHPFHRRFRFMDHGLHPIQTHGALPGTSTASAYCAGNAACINNHAYFHKL